MQKADTCLEMFGAHHTKRLLINDSDVVDVHKVVRCALIVIHLHQVGCEASMLLVMMFSVPRVRLVGAEYGQHE